MPFLRVDGDLQPAPFAELTSEDAAAFALAVMSEHKRQEFETTNEADIGYTLQGVGRFRINVFRQRGLVGLAVRRVRSEIPTFEELRLPGRDADARRQSAWAGVDHRTDRDREDHDASRR